MSLLLFAENLRCGYCLANLRDDLRGELLLESKMVDSLCGKRH